MRMNRRNVLVGLGTIVAGGGAALGTGAFSSVTADRTVNVNVEEDSSAFLGLSEATDAGNYVSTDSDGAIQIDIGESGTDGINTNAKTTFDELVTITNNGTNNVDGIDFELSGTNNPSDAITVTPDGFGTDGTGTFPDDGGSGDSTILAPAESVTFGLEIDIRDDEPGTEDDLEGVTLTITASTPGN